METWNKESAEFSRKYNVNIRLTLYTDRCGDVLMIEMAHTDDPKTIVRYKKLHGTYIHPCERISNYFERLYEKLPIVRRNKRYKDVNFVDKYLNYIIYNCPLHSEEIIKAAVQSFISSKGFKEWQMKQRLNEMETDFL